MMTVVIAVWLLANPDCDGACSNRANQCYSSCGGAEKCANRCGAQQTSCVLDCEGQREKARTTKRAQKPLPCDATREEGARPCSADEKAAMDKALSSKQAKALCRDAEGNRIACKEDQERALAKYEEIMRKCKEKGNKGEECPQPP